MENIKKSKSPTDYDNMRRGMVSKGLITLTEKFLILHIQYFC